MDREQTIENVIQNLRQLAKNPDQDKNGIVDLLSRVNSLGNQNVADTRSITNEFVDCITRIKPAELKLVVGCCQFLAHLIAQKKLDNLEEHQLHLLLLWLQTLLESSVESTILCAALSTVSTILKAHPQLAAQYWDKLFHPKDSTLLQHLESDTNSENRNEELLVVAFQCLDSVLGCLLVLDTPLTAVQLEVCEAAANTLLRLHYSVRPPCSSFSFVPLFLLSSLSLLNKITALCPAYAQEHVTELFGLAKAYLQCGIGEEDAPPPIPQKILASQQSVYDSAEEVDGTDSTTQSRSGGKVSKTRKPRAVTKGTRQMELGQKQRFNPDELVGGMLGLDIKTSDSDVSESETATNRILQDRHRYGKVRLASITLLGIVARSQERRASLFGYWHAFFPSTVDSRDNLMYVGLRDPNARCRSAALQVSSQLLFGSKGFLSQAESEANRCSTAFIPFAINLGHMVLAMYDALTSILAAECSLPVLTQALKCLAVLVQATSFQRFEPGFVSRFVQHVRPLVQHRDYTIQVSALMVMEFLVASTELTPEIAKVVGLPRASIKPVNGNALSDDADVDLTEEGFVEYLESDDAESEEDNSTKATAMTTKSIDGGTSPWLLLRVLHNLDDDGHRRIKVPTSVRIESLQVISAMANHFTLLSTHLERVALALHHALRDDVSDVRLYAARCFDSCAYQIGCHLLDKSSAVCADVVADCDRFWLSMLPVIMEHIRGTEEDQLTPTALKVCLCDALSNIGVVIFERLPHLTQINLINFLSGIGSDAAEEMTVRAATVRALAVFVLFPSLRNNLVFVENTAELMLRLVNDTNLQVRVKAVWSMGNVSDVLICGGGGGASHERISDDLLRRMIEATTQACSDNDKVRCNAVRTLGNLLHLLTEQHLNDSSDRARFQKAIGKLIDCIRSSGNAKVKWNSCYAIGNIMRNRALFTATAKYSDLDWQTSLYPALCHIIVNHSNFKVRINATAVIVHIEERSNFGTYFVLFWSALLSAIEQSYNLDNFYEYNHRDYLQEQLCLAMCHVIGCACLDDFPMLKKNVAERLEVVRNTWLRVTNRMVPEKAAPLLSCSVLLRERLRDNHQVTSDQRNAVVFIAQTFTVE